MKSKSDGIFHFICIIVLLVVLTILIACIPGGECTDGGDVDRIKIGIISDIHWRDDALRELPNNTVLEQKLDEFIDTMNEDFCPTFTVQLGDLACSLEEATNEGMHVSEDDYIDRLANATNYLENDGGSWGTGLNSTLYHVLGNHEYRIPQWNKTRIHETLGFSALNKTWYVVRTNGIAFIFMNTGYTHNEVRNHTIPVEELQWLERTLNETHVPTFIFTHIPVTPFVNNPYANTNGQERARAAIEGDGDVVAVIFGHLHHDNSWDRNREHLVSRNGVRYYHITAPHEYMDDTAITPWGELEIYLNGTYILNSSYETDSHPRRWSGTFEDRNIVVDDDNGSWADTDKIQTAIDIASEGDRIWVHDGQYRERLLVTKHVTIWGNGSRCMIDAKRGPGIKLTTGAKVSGFRIRNASVGIWCKFADDSVLTWNRLTGCSYGIYVDLSDNVTIENCTANDCRIGIVFIASDSCTLRDNNVSKNKIGVFIIASDPILMVNNDISSNRVNNKNLTDSSGNLVVKKSRRWWRPLAGPRRHCDKTPGQRNTRKPLVRAQWRGKMLKRN